MLFRKFSFYLAIIGMIAAVALVQRVKRSAPKPPPVSEPARSPFPSTVAATGLIEAARENVKVAASKPGLVIRVHVSVGSNVKKGDPLFQIDARELQARLKTTESQIGALQANLALDDVQIADWTDQLERFTRLERDKVATEDERKRREFALQGARAKQRVTQSQIEALLQQIEQVKTEIEVLTVRAPRDGQLLQVNVREGEFAPASAMAEPLMLLGDVDSFQVRAEVDEQNAVRIQSGQPGHATLKGHADQRIDLKFVRIEPYVVPKRSLTGDSMERVDTRVLQVIFAFERPRFPVYVGQQVDVFIQRSETIARDDSSAVR